MCVGARKFLKGEARDFGDDIVNAWLKTCRGGGGDVVIELV